MVIKSFGMTDIGLNRVENQDAFSIDDEVGIYIVADGMGGMENGSEAAGYIVREFCVMFSARLAEAYGKAETSLDIEGALTAAIDDLNDGVRNEISPHSGSTIVMLFNIEHIIFVANLGDSPGYLFREGKLIRITKEHNVAGILLDSGKITPEEARTHPARHQLTAYVGMSGKTTTHVASFKLKDGDRLLLCSDGLTGMVPENEIGDVLSEESDLKGASERLVRMANEAGGYDNITVVLLECGDNSN